ncbi:NADP-dependent malic enzyme [Desulfuromonas acetoxidans]|uniref:Malate dehydrogenase (Oxaloacetate decarboxylating) (NADP+)., Phosphate acetyltransferase n=1 Tax=Desulfuromonas acetoxidans (strain DSM 684 / 11070) TaxID=281689 RepID=Q1K0K0_DESA6|nr:NADP-dependent malic enzyme [Desulfuromonas acetoxidans]EAT15941.1 Malate dehydrogenase (oxaloacetate decarboxylating) (NADP+)., Phosphate acetyltransferase [Desulfuromonas acetoxidans DSM 684]MBF0644161.1 NADP-dependent malic enzyme [Desulfuromonas acetoxidans]NVD24541.1 NADP-dependent malic enzyme [Desulfuromonas acetoxidans]NVE16509.1 NADP-dependent malic enzyme [Desulfuromonas acetoxidans]
MAKKQDALDYHSSGRKGKIEVIATKPCDTSRDLSLAYSPGVAEPCLAIEESPEDAYKYTAKGNLVAVISNGSAVLGLGDIGALAGKPVMEGKGILFKRFADIDVFDIELNTKEPDEIINTVRLLEPTFGGINLEDIKAPECFYIEEKLKEVMNIPVFHDDQHGTAIIANAGLINALELIKKDISKIKIVVNGAGAAGIACAQMALTLGAKKENMILCDSKGVIYKGRTEGMNDYKARLATEMECRTLEEAMVDADVFFGVSAKDAVTPEMVASMAADPILFAMANPDPEILPSEAIKVRSDVIVGTGRSDFPNQVNNVLCFPFLFRGALDTHATAINDEMKMAAVKALANLAKEDVPDSVIKAYGNTKFSFGRDYLIPKPFDPRVLLHVAPAVAKAAIDSGVATRDIGDINKYTESLEALQGRSKEIMRTLINKAKSDRKRIVFPEGDNEKILRATQILIDEKIAIPILLGPEDKIKGMIKELSLDLHGVQIIDTKGSPKHHEYSNELFRLRQRKGVTLAEASRTICRERNYYGAMMVRMGDADAMLSGVNHHYPETIRPALEVIGKQPQVKGVHGLYMMVFKKDVIFCADTTVTIDPTAEELAETAILAANKARHFDVEPRVAMLSFSNYGSALHPFTSKVIRATQLVKEWAPNLVVDGEVQANVALDPDLTEQQYPFSQLKGNANVLVFPDLNSGNISYKLLSKLGGAEAVGPILMGMKKPVHVLQRGDEVNDIVNMAAVAVVDAQDAFEKEINNGYH